MKKRIILVLGYTGSGKTTYCKDYAAKEGYKYVDVSDFVKKRLNHSKKYDIANEESRQLAKDIAIDIVDYLNDHNKAIIDGIRQWSIVEFICKSFFLHELEIRWLEVPLEELKVRFESRTNAENNLTFEEVYKKDNDLGLAECKKEISNLIQIVKNY